MSAACGACIARAAAICPRQVEWARAGLTAEQAAATIFSIGYPGTYRALVIDGEWTGARWAQSALESALILTELDGSATVDEAR